MLGFVLTDVGFRSRYYRRKIYFVLPDLFSSNIYKRMDFNKNLVRYLLTSFLRNAFREVAVDMPTNVLMLSHSSKL